MSKAEQISNVSNETVLHFILEAMNARRAIDEATGAYRAILKRAKADGCDTDAITSTLKAKKLDPDVVRDKLRNQIRYLAVINMPVHQTDLFDALDMAPINTKAQSQLLEADAEAQGYDVGRHGGMIESCPHRVGSELYVRWRDGWTRGQEVIARELGDNAKAASPRKEKGRGNAASTEAPAAKPAKPAKAKGKETAEPDGAVGIH